MTVNKLTLKNKLTDTWGIFKCECGKEIKCLIKRVSNNWKTSCGCKRKRHGLEGHPLQAVWNGMKARCYNVNNHRYHRYGGRGVVVCEEWKNDFKAFYDWGIKNGWKQGMQIDKDIKGTGLLYSPEMCIFTTNKVNCNRRSHTVLIERCGVTKSIMEWCEYYGINQSTFYSRLKTGWSFEKALITPKQNTKIKYSNKQ